MKTFSVEGTSSDSLPAAMANAMAQAASVSGPADHFDFSIMSAIKDDDGVFHVMVSVRAHDAEEDAEPDEDEGKGDASGRERDNAYHRRRSEIIYMRIHDNLIRQFETTTYMPDPAEAFEAGREMVIESTPDTVEYAQSVSDLSGGSADRQPVETPIFTSVSESADAYGPTPGADTSRINVWSREFDEVVGLLSLGFYEPPRPEQGVPEVVVEAPDNGDVRDRVRRADEDIAPLPTQPPTDMRPSPGV